MLMLRKIPPNKSKYKAYIILIIQPISSLD